MTEVSFTLEQAQSGYRMASIELNTILGLPVDKEIQLPDIPDAILMKESGSIDIENKPELKQAAASIAMANTRIDLVKSDYFPKLSIFSGFSYGKPNNDLFNNDWNDNYTVGARLDWSFNLGHETGKKIRQMNYQLGSARQGYEMIKEALTKQEQLYREKVSISHIRYLSARENLQITSDNYRLAKNKHKEGTLSSNRLMEIETTLSQAEASLATALADYYIAHSMYLYATGSDDLRKGL